MQLSKELTPEQQDAASKLNDRQLAFANLVLTKPGHGMSSAECYRAAGYKPRSDKSAQDNASKMIGLDRISAYLKLMREESVKDTRLTLEQLDRDLEESIFDNVITSVVTSVDGVLELKCELDKLPEAVARNIQKVKQTEHGLQVKMYSRYDARKLGYERLGGLVQKTEDVTPRQLIDPSDLEAIRKLAYGDRS